MTGNKVKKLSKGQYLLIASNRGDIYNIEIFENEK